MLVSKALKKMNPEEEDQAEVEEEADKTKVEEVETETRRKTLKRLKKNTQPYEESEGPSYITKGGK